MMDKELSLIKECPNDECEHFNGHSKMCYSCGWIEARQHYTRAKVAQEIFEKIEKTAFEPYTPKPDYYLRGRYILDYGKYLKLKAEYGVQG